MVKKAKITVYCCGLFRDSILSKRAGFSICRSNFSQGPYSNIIQTLVDPVPTFIEIPYNV